MPCDIINFQDWRDHQKIDVFDGRATLITFFAMAFIVGAFNSYSPNANAPRESVEGIARFVGQARGRGGYKEYICAESCQQAGGYALALHDEAASAIHIDSPYRFPYLEHPEGKAFLGISLRVSSGNEEEEEEPRGSGPISLGLESKDSG